MSLSFLLGMQISIKYLIEIIKNRKKSNISSNEILISFLLQVLFPLLIYSIILSLLITYKLTPWFLAKTTTLSLTGAKIKWGLLTFYSIFFLLFGIRKTDGFWKYLKKFNLIARTNEQEYKLQDPVIEEKIRTICKKVNIEIKEIYINPIHKVNAEVKTVFFSRKYNILITKKSITLNDALLTAIIGHELGHIKKKDIICFIIPIPQDWIIWTCVTLGIIGIQILFNILLDKIFFLPHVLRTTCLYIVLFFLFNWFVLFTIDIRRYWYQIQEIRADRYACDMLGVPPEDMISLLKILEKKQKSKKSIANLSWYKKIYEKFFMISEHPCIEQRIKLLENYRKWSFKEYISHAIRMGKWLFTGRGWTGDSK